MFACFVTCLFAPLYALFPFAFFFCLFAQGFLCFFTFSLLVYQFCVFFVCCMYTLGPREQLIKMQAKRAKMQANMSIAFQTRAFFPCILFGRHSQGMAMSDLYIPCTLLRPHSLGMAMIDLYFSCTLLGSYPQDVVMSGFIFLLCVLPLCMLDIYIYIYIYIFCLKMVVHFA